MVRSARTFALAAVLVLAAAAGAGAAEADLTEDLKLAAEGGVTLKVPAWKRARPDKEDTAVLEHEAKGDAKFHLLVVTVEAGPKGDGAIDWDVVRKNIVDEASKGGAVLELALGGDFTDADGWRGQRMTGTLKAKDAALAVELVALAREARLVTLSVVSAAPSGEAGELLGAVAKTARLEAR